MEVAETDRLVAISTVELVAVEGMHGMGVGPVREKKEAKVKVDEGVKELKVKMDEGVKEVAVQVLL